MKSLTIIGRRWFASSYGNTYHSAEIVVDGRLLTHTPAEYGYGDAYIQTATRALKTHGLIPGQATAPLRTYCAKHKIALYTTCADVGRRKDL